MFIEHHFRILQIIMRIMNSELYKELKINQKLYMLIQVMEVGMYIITAFQNISIIYILNFNGHAY